MNKQNIAIGLIVGSLLIVSCSNGQSTNVPAPTATTAAVSAAEATATPEPASASVPVTEVITTTDSSTTGSSTTTNTTEDSTPGIVAAANTFLATLSDVEKATTLFDWTDTAQKQRWSNFPPAGFQRDGLMWGNMSETQQNAWLAVMQATLSSEGYNRVLAEWNADDALLAQEGTGGGFSFGLAAVLIAIGILLVRSRSLVDRFGGMDSRWSSALPLASAVIVTVLGIGITLSGLMAYLA